MNYITAGFQQISTSAQGVGVHEEVVLDEIVADRAGYLLAYLSNENDEAVDVHFDDFEVRHAKTNVVQAVDYYPFGLIATSYTRTAADPTKYLYNGGVEKNPHSGYYETFYRQYDASIGRFMGVDIAAAQFTSQTPYQYAFNDPVTFNDPLGDMPDRVRQFMETEGAGYWHMDGGPGGGGGGSSFGSYTPWYGPSYEDKQLKAHASSFLSEALGIPFGEDGSYAYISRVGTWEENGMSILQWNYGRIDINGLMNSSNPMLRAYASAIRNGDIDKLRNFQNKSIHYSHGDYLKEISRTDNLGRQLADFTGYLLGGTILSTVAAPVLIPAITQSGAFSLSANTSVTGNFVFEFSGQTASQLALTGEVDIGAYDVVDLGLSATKLKFIGQALSGALIDVNFNQGINYDKSARDIGIDLGIDLINPGFRRLGRSIRPSDKIGGFLVDTGGVVVETGGSFSKSSKHD